MGEARKQTDPGENLFQDGLVYTLSGTTWGTMHPAVFPCETGHFNNTLYWPAYFHSSLSFAPTLLSRACTSLKKAVTEHCLKLSGLHTMH